MQVLPIFNINSPTAKKSFSNPLPSFKSLQKTVSSETGELLYRATTFMFRNDINWIKVFNIIKEQSPSKIYCYACSDGSEPYSIVMGLNRVLGFEKAKQFFPVLARDIDSDNIAACNQGIINFSLGDITKIKNFTGMELKQYFTKIYDEKGFPLLYKACDNLRNSIVFTKSDFLQDIACLDLANNILFCRNVWPYFSETAIVNAATELGKKFNNKTRLVLGNFDMTYKGGYIPQKLIEYGNLCEDSSCRNVFKKQL